MSNPSFNKIKQTRITLSLQTVLLKLLGYQLQPVSITSLHFKRGPHNVFINSAATLFRHYEP